MREAHRITPKNLSQLAWRAGYRGVTGLARHLNRHRVSLYRAAANPGLHRPTAAAIAKALSRHEQL